MIRVPGSGSASAKLLVCGQWPGPDEERLKTPLVGASGKLHDQICTEVGIRRNETYMTNVLKVRPPENQLKRLSELKLNLEDFVLEVKDEIRRIKPYAILALGDLALTSLTDVKGKVTNFRGSILKANFQCVGSDGQGYFPKVIPTFNPAALLHGDSYSLGWSAIHYITLDYKRAFDESKYKHFDMPIRKTTIIRTGRDAEAFYYKYRDANLIKASVDIESAKCIPICAGVSFSPNEAGVFPLLSVGRDCNVEDKEFPAIYDVLDKILRNSELIGQNFKYDQGKLEQIYGFRCNTFIADVAMMAQVLHPELKKNLGFLTSIYTREPFYKFEGKEFNIGKDSIQKLWEYNAKDAMVTFEIYQEFCKLLIERGFSDFYFNFQHKLHVPYKEMEKVGFHVNLEVRQRLIQKYTKLLAEQERYLEFVCDNPHIYRSPVAVGKLLYGRLGIPERNDTSEETLCALLANTVKDVYHRDIIESIYKARRLFLAKSKISYPMDYDDRYRTSININGTETSRTTNSLPSSPQKRIARPDPNGLVFQIITKHGDFGADMGEMLDADPGHVFVSPDQSQAEARVVALLAEDYELLRLFDTIDVHRLTASWIFERPYEQVGTGSAGDRFIGKCARHAGAYGMQKRRHMLDVQSKARKFNIPINISEADAGRNLKKFHENSPKIQGVYHKRIKDALIRNEGCLINPFGRPRDFLDKFSEDLLREAYAHYPQSTIGDKTKKVLMQMTEWKPDLKFIMESHDALLCMPKEEEKMEVALKLKEFFEEPINFEVGTLKAQPLIIPCEIQMGYDFKNLKKVKL